ncbi:anti-sigma-K factor RskA [Nocardia brasiliensis NBRC 14402]|uniref:anti-sigma factor n=1 Tax=Nocardia brasiliensis TaxID=37326 RepID=UPI0002FF2058|nr:anti-sigma factor [Nocardia brasiliensis]ASF06803.1 hypothetical protein CEQ30_05065 [Nocardia brasiliensis]GAJ85345.1 anti-sigma-K factor RskA [Nocardia brasiliensis NBRC 14402]SUB47991.1 Regulator of sigK [Nocardia brasiliensis]
MNDTERSGRDLLDLAYPYAMDAVAELERRTIEHRLREADPAVAAAFATIVSGVRETLAALTVLDATAPPPTLEATLLRALDISAGAPAKRGIGRLRWVAAAAAVVVAIGAGAVVYRNSTQPPSGITAQVVLAQPDVLVRSAPVAGGGRLVVYTSAGIGAATASFEDVPAPAPGRSYQMWLVATDGATRSVGVMTELPSGPAVVTRFAAVDVLAVTDEPAAGSPKPTGDAIAKIGLA